jgi:hypothetical protein
MQRPSDFLASLASLMGASGVALAAYSTHAGGGDLGRTAAYFLILHAAALIGVTAAARAGSAARARRLLVAGAGWRRARCCSRATSPSSPSPLHVCSPSPPRPAAR